MAAIKQRKTKYSVIYWTVEVERRVEYKENEWLPCDESGRIDDGYGTVATRMRF